MDNKIEFGHCLNQILLIREWSAARLAKEINVDSSYVRKWIRGERVPSLKSNYIEQIAVSISKGLELPSKEYIHKDIFNYIKTISESVDESKPLEVLIRELLFKAQFFSLSMKLQTRNFFDEISESKIINILAHSDAGRGRSIKLYEDIEKAFIKDITEIPSYIEGRYEVTSAILSMLSAASDNETLKSDEIFITYQSNENCFNGNDEHYDAFKKLITRLLEKGCQIHYLCRLNENINRSLILVGEIIDWSHYKDVFLPAFFTKYGITAPPSEIVAVKGIGALFCFAAESDEYVDRAYFYGHEKAAKALYSYVLKMHMDTSPLIKNLQTKEEYYEFITSKDRQAGDFCGICNDLHTCTIPLNQWEKYLLRAFKDEDAIKPHMRRIGERIQYFYEDVKKHKVRHVYRIEAINYLIKKVSYFCQANYQPTRAEVLEHLRNIIRLLKTYENFEIALLSEEQKNVIPYYQWEVKGGSTVVMSTWNPGENDKYINIAITEETVAGAFQDYFLEIWERITPEYRDKNYVISWFEDQADWFEKNML